MSNGIGWAVKQMFNGDKVFRTGWNGKNMWLAIKPGQIPDELSHVYIKTVDNKIVPWTCSQTDLLATDWESKVQQLENILAEN